MKFQEPGLYHIYNRGINRQPIFIRDGDYLFFLTLCHKFIAPRCQILAWCLMPNHFHFLIQVDDESVKLIVWGGNEMPSISNGFQLLLSSYAKMINKRENRTGSLFQQKTKSLLLENQSYARTAFWYMHQNPVKASIVTNMLDWKYSSFQDYCGLRQGKLCNISLGKDILGLPEIDFISIPMLDLTEEELVGIF